MQSRLLGLVMALGLGTATACVGAPTPTPPPVALPSPVAPLASVVMVGEGRMLLRAKSVQIEHGRPYFVELNAHCSLELAIIDVDGSFWGKPVFRSGPTELGFTYDRGTIDVSPTDPDSATYTTEAGGIVSLTRGSSERKFRICA